MARIDEEYIQKLIDAHGGALTLLARQSCRAPEDALQEALIELARQDPIPDNPVAWIYAVVRRRAMNLGRAENRRRKHHRQAGQQRESWFLPSDDGLDEPIDFESLLDQLPQLEREVVVARVWGQLSFCQIAELVGQSTSSVHRRYQQALVKLGQAMNQQLDHTRRTDEPRQSISR